MKFSEDGIMNSKVYQDNHQIGGKDLPEMIFIPYYESTFNNNDGQPQVWQEETIVSCDQRVKAIVLCCQFFTTGIFFETSC